MPEANWEPWRARWVLAGTERREWHRFMEWGFMPHYERWGEDSHFKNVTGFDPRSGPISAPPFTSYLNSVWKTANKTIFLRILHNNLYNIPSIVSCDQEVTSPRCTHDSESQIQNVYSFVFSLLEESVHWALKKQLDTFSIKLVM